MYNYTCVSFLFILQTDKESLAGGLAKLEKENTSLKQRLDKNKQEIDRLEGVISSKVR